MPASCFVNKRLVGLIRKHGALLSDGSIALTRTSIGKFISEVGKTFGYNGLGYIQLDVWRHPRVLEHRIVCADNAE
eukprot:1122008-Pyramimonas_sp.AAC.1